MTYLVSVNRKENSEDFIVTVYNTELGAHLRTAFNLKKYDCEYSKAIGNGVEWAVSVLDKKAKYKLRFPDVKE